MTVDFLDLPPERREFRRHITDFHLDVDIVIVLDTVSVDNKFEVPSGVKFGSHNRLPHLPLLQFAVPDHHPDVPITAVHSSSERATEPEGEPHSQTSCREIDPIGPLHVDMTLAHRAHGPETH